MQKFWDPDKLLSRGASYNIAIGRAAVGKSFAMRKKIIEHYITTGEQSTYIVRFDINIKHTAKYLFAQFDGYIISTLTNDKFNHVVYKNGCFYLAKLKNDKIDIVDNVPFCRIYSLEDYIKNKFEKIFYWGKSKYIVYDEFLTPKYIPFDFEQFIEFVGTLAKDSTDTQVVLLDNFRCFDLTFFDKMGVTGIRSQYPGTIDYYILNTGLKIAAEVISG